jgi:ribonucleoside-triphosphate reductase
MSLLGRRVLVVEDDPSIAIGMRRSLERFRLPYITVTPTFSICPSHGYLAGEHEYCPKCDDERLEEKRRRLAA